MTSLSAMDCHARVHGFNGLVALGLYQVLSHLRLHVSLFPGDYQQQTFQG